MPPKKKKRGGGGGGFSTTTATAAAASADDDNDDDDKVSLPPVSKKAALAKTRADDAARANAAAAKADTTAAAAVTAAAGVATACTTAAGVATIESYFGASGAPNTRAITLPRLPIFQLNQGLVNDMGRKSTAPATALVAAAAAGKAEAGKAASDVIIPRNQPILTTAVAVSVPTADDGESFGSGFDLHNDISFSGGGDMGGVENEGVEEDAGVEDAELAALTSVFNCDHINRKTMNDKDGWECGW